MNTCHISNPECVAPAGYATASGWANGTDSVGRTRCYICDQPVCKVCSRLVTWHKRRVRACDNCIDDYRIGEDRAA